MPFQPVESQRLYERVAHQIGDLIHAGEYGPGDRLPAERDLAKTLAVSRPVVREALIALEVAGLVEVKTGSGAYVRAKPTPGVSVHAGASPSETLNARMLIEGEIAALAAANASPADLARIAAEFEEMQKAQSAGRSWAGADLGFHLAVAASAGNAALVGVVERLWQEQYGPLFALLSRRVNLVGNWPATHEGHQRILTALQARKPPAARRAMRAHLEQVLDVMTRDGEASL